MKKLILALALLPTLAQAEMQQVAPCKDLYFEKAHILVVEEMCHIKGNNLAEISNKIKSAQCLPLSKHDISMYLDTQMAMFNMMDHGGWYCESNDAFKTVGAVNN